MPPADRGTRAPLWCGRGGGASCRPGHACPALVRSRGRCLLPTGARVPRFGAVEGAVPPADRGTRAPLWCGRGGGASCRPGHACPALVRSRGRCRLPTGARVPRFGAVEVGGASCRPGHACPALLRSRGRCRLPTGARVPRFDPVRRGEKEPPLIFQCKHRPRSWRFNPASRRCTAGARDAASRPGRIVRRSPRGPRARCNPTSLDRRLQRLSRPEGRRCRCRCSSAIGLTMRSRQWRSCGRATWIYEAGEVLIGQGYAVSLVEFTERDGRITVETVWRKPEGVQIELEDLPF